MKQPPQSPGKLTEFSWLKQMFQTTLMPLQGNGARTNLALPPGDDCAEVVLEYLGNSLGDSLNKSQYQVHNPQPHKTTPFQTPSVLFASDMLMDGVHFDLREIHPSWVGTKAVRVNLSDIAAMGGCPLSITVSLALPRRRGAALGQEVMEGVAETCRQYHLTIAGGDTNTWDGPLVVNVAIIGLPHHRQSVTRAGAKPGDGIYVSGPLGGSLLSGRHLCFSPRIDLARYLQDHYQITSMLDISDGLGSDLRHILRQSQVGATIDRALIPLHRDLLLDAESSRVCREILRNFPPRTGFHTAQNQASEEFFAQGPLTNQNKVINNDFFSEAGGTDLRNSLVERALGDGEDFELCWTMSTEDGAKLALDLEQNENPLFKGLTIAQIGMITNQCEKLLWQDGTEVRAKGYEHQLETKQT
jgi:thiamine monophosphate kinase